VFGGGSKFMRYVDNDQRLKRRRAAPVAFIDNPKGTHLSVHSLDLASKTSIAKYYRDTFQDGRGNAAFCIHTVYEYNEASNGTNGSVKFNRKLSSWEFIENEQSCAAYKHRPENHYHPHCGVEYVRALDELEMMKVARRLATRKYEIA
jgi:hypothetical protein